ncbi:unnamed protein product, partial [marine sediment metagenome]
VVIIAAVVFLAGIASWVGYEYYKDYKSDPLREVVIEVNGVPFNMEYFVKTLDIYVPLSTFYATLAPDQVTSRGHMVQAIAIQANSKDDVNSATDEITAILRDRHRLREWEEDDFSVISMESMAGIAGEMLGLIRLILAAIAGISLLVGAIGIM